jgi:2-amino-4-hydroxy-6-hydroxymethyldihydropteridine diphosphokinase
MRTAYIGMGANLASWAGAPEATLAAAALRLESLGRVVCRSSLYSTAPVGFAEQPRFVNAVVELETELEPRDATGEVAGHRAGVWPRPGGELCERAALAGPGHFALRRDRANQRARSWTIPHPRLAERAFVLMPLNEIAPQAVVPGVAKTVGQLLTRLLEAAKAESDAVVRVKSDTWAPRFEVSQMRDARPLIAIRLR